MAAPQLIDGSQPTDRDPAPSTVAVPRIIRDLPLLVAGALLIVILYAAFDHGAVSLAAATRVEVAIAAVAVLAVATWLGGLRLTVSRSALAGLGLLAAFAAWSGITLVWSVAPDQTWIELNRDIAYVLVAGTAIVVGARHPGASTLVAKGFFAIALVTALYALGQKLVPGLHIPGIFDLNQTGAVPRLQEPIGYWNALALFVVLGVPMALHLAADSTRPRTWRLAAACALEVMLLVIALTLSRGGIVALLVALLVGLLFAPGRVRALAWLALSVLATIPPLVVGLTAHSLSAAGVALSTREVGGAALARVLIGSLVALVLGGRGLMAVEPRLRLGPVAGRRARRIAVVGLGVVLAAGLVAAILTHAWHGFTSPSAPNNISPNRLLTTDSYRWLWWKEAANAFAARPFGGWGAGSFGVVHLIYRQNTLPVQQPHSVPLQFLSETGIVGALLGLGALAVLLAAALAGVRRRQLAGAERGVAGALLAAAVAYLVHCLYDWDWNIPAVTLPALMFLGVLAGAGSRVDGDRPRDGVGGPGLGIRAVALAVATLWLCFFAVSAVLPSLAASQANAALVDASSSSPAALSTAEAKARRASSLDPLSDAGWRAQASIALHRGRLARARYYLERAVGREPSDELAWDELAQVDSFLGDRSGERQAARRVIALDPRGPNARSIRSSGLLNRGS